ncbi:centrosomal protein of 41 kDa [Menidia menidia]
MSLNRSIGRAEYMKKRIPKLSKYDHVKTRLDTGCSLTKYMERLEDMRKNYRYRKDEIFKRLKCTTFAQLIIQVASISDLSESEIDGNSQDSLSVVSDADLECVSERMNVSPMTSPQLPSQDLGDNKDICPTSRSTLLSVISGVGELNLDEKNHKMAKKLVQTPVDGPYPDCPYLLLDVRDCEQYDNCHIISAHSFPIAMLSRTINPYTKEVLEYKNAPGKIIIVYDEDERMASQAATVMCERGFENLFMLSGGLKVIAQKFPSGMTTGSIPASCLLSPKSQNEKKSSTLQQPMQAADRRWRFTSDELAQIQEQLEEIFIPSNSSSRLSSRMSDSSIQSKASSHQNSTVGRKSSRVQSSRPWK